MAINKIQTNIIDALSNVAKQQLELRGEMISLVNMYTNEGIGQLLDADIQALPELSHVTASEIQTAKNSMDTILTTLGDFTAGTPASRLLKIVKNLP